MEIKILKDEGCPEWVIKHSIAVYKKAIEISENFDDVDLDLIKKGALLHDLGRSKTNKIEHGVIGSKIAKEHGFPPEVCSIIEKHIGAGISEDESEKIGLPKKSYIPITLEEKIVAHSDNLFNGSDEVNIEFTIKKWKGKIDNYEESVVKLRKLNYELIEQFKK